MTPKSEEFGWTAVPRNRSNVPSADDANTQDVTVDMGEIWPDTEVVNKANDYAKRELPQETYNHSLRVYCYGHTIVTQHFPTWATPTFFETWALTCLFHDIGTTASNRSATHLSFEFQGGFIALATLQGFGPHLVSTNVIKQVVGQLPRLGWSNCFSSAINAEVEEKPWCHTTVLEGFAEAVAGNELMKPYE
ncbi:cyanamide hydratase [Pyrenophora seminiperda CCB06]|uniref:Cyanamide hydratase n=1 Tax=Pyrenophora seminiperda CCB06 TaxID=1302712 RepID=A0A3M7MJ28_9PLEO|nr:cyanamide hydratase [Pyrenophora seminiperda CCB06]